MTMLEKATKANENFDLTRVEINRIYSAAKRRNRGRLPELTAWYSAHDSALFRTVECEICDGLTGERLQDVVILCCLFDRRKSEILP